MTHLAFPLGWLPPSYDTEPGITKLGGRPTFFENVPKAIQQSVKQRATCDVCKRPLYLIAQCYCPIPLPSSNAAASSKQPAATTVEEQASSKEGKKERVSEGETDEDPAAVLDALAPPTEDAPEEIERMMYLFCCNGSRCASQPQRSWKCFTVQLGDATSHLITPPQDTSEEAHDGDDDDAGDIAGRGDHNNEDDDVDDEENPDLWTFQAKPPPSPRSLYSFRSFPPIELDVMPEPKTGGLDAALPPLPSSLSSQQTSKIQMCKNQEEAMEEISKINPGITEQDLEELDRQVDLGNKPTDIYYQKFCNVMAKKPNQVLRWRRHGVPVFMNPEKTIHETVPPCAICGGPRAMELQLMPTSIFFLKVPKYVDPEVRKERAPAVDEGVDFGTVTVYSCLRGCSSSLDKIQAKLPTATATTPPTTSSSAAATPAAATAVSSPPPVAAASASSALCVNRCLLTVEHIFVEPQPTLEDERSGTSKITLREMMTNNDMGPPDGGEGEGEGAAAGRPTPFAPVVASRGNGGPSDSD